MATRTVHGTRSQHRGRVAACAGSAFCLMAWLAAPAVAQDIPRSGTLAPSGSHPVSGGSMSHGVIIAPRDVDPGMMVRAPRMLAQSTPVIKPRTTDRDTVVVPR